MTETERWRPRAGLDVLKQRAQMLSRIRAFFAERDVLEVETPILSAAGSTDPHLHSFVASWAGSERYLQTSPEFAMKRLLAADSGSIYQIARVFRGDEVGRLHNPEFTLLEWYRTHVDHHELMEEVAALVTCAFAKTCGSIAFEKISYREAFERYADVDPHSASSTQLATTAREHHIHITDLPADDIDAWRDLLLTHLVEPHLGRQQPTFVYDYPQSQAALARIRPGDPPLAERFELYINGIEIANGFHELTDAAEQRGRFERDRRVRLQRQLADIPQDENLLHALQHGLPPCSGVALGIDRLLMLATGSATVTDVIAFPFDRA